MNGLVGEAVQVSTPAGQVIGVIESYENSILKLIKVGRVVPTQSGGAIVTLAGPIYKGDIYVVGAFSIMELNKGGPLYKEWYEATSPLRMARTMDEATGPQKM